MRPVGVPPLQPDRAVFPDQSNPADRGRKDHGEKRPVRPEAVKPRRRETPARQHGNGEEEHRSSQPETDEQPEVMASVNHYPLVDVGTSPGARRPYLFRCSMQLRPMVRPNEQNQTDDRGDGANDNLVAPALRRPWLAQNTGPVAPSHIDQPQQHPAAEAEPETDRLLLVQLLGHSKPPCSMIERRDYSWN